MQDHRIFRKVFSIQNHPLKANFRENKTSSFVFFLTRSHSSFKKKERWKIRSALFLIKEDITWILVISFHTLYRTVWFSTLSRSGNFMSIFIDTPANIVSFSTLHLLVATVWFTFWKRATTNLDVRAWWWQRLDMLTDTSREWSWWA